MAIPIVHRETIMRNLRTLLQGITTGNGYFVSVNTVDRVVQEYDNVRDKFPYIGLAEGIQETVTEIPSDTAHHEFEVQLVSYIDKLSSGDSANATVEGNEVCNAWIKAIMHRLNSDRTLGAQAIDIRVLDFRTNQGEVFDDGVWIRAIDMTLRIEYELTRSSKTD